MKTHFPPALRDRGASGEAQPRAALADMLGRSLGAEVARAAVAASADKLGLGDLLSRRDALRVLEDVAEQPGIVGIAARFAKSRLHLVWASDTASGL